MPTLAVNIDHVATIRQARLATFPDPLKAALAAEEAGAHGIIAHLREDRRHINDNDVERIAKETSTLFHLEMAATDEMRKIARRVKPYSVCLVPEKRKELTTEGGLAVAGRVKHFKDYVGPLQDDGIKISLFIEASSEQIDAAAEIGVEYVEIHTGHYADAEDYESRKRELEKIFVGIGYAQDLGLKVNVGHGLDYDNILSFSKIPAINEYSIGFSIIAEAVFTGLKPAVARMAALVADFSA